MQNISLNISVDVIRMTKEYLDKKVTIDISFISFLRICKRSAEKSRLKKKM